ncbi:acyl-homoserine-lactone synthase [Pseudomonas anguilliseptica]|uniref:acyl-homoserine-lactone synthase n=1 Tax=Pseudomonas anguilliseptica TaxID=53406 RepID=UPI0022AF0C7B|nr:acyl-homoserine-lactone synthase [Pseudomonas anguilliseptica]MCZ4324345.1 GNAT family N-acetyltransferase [Pseudomonas anguilliseptica]
MHASTQTDNTRDFRLIIDPHLSQLTACLELREAVFARELRWVATSVDGQERDVFDPFSVHVAVIHRWRPAGYLRITPYGSPWMLSACFDFLLEPGVSERFEPDSLEVSRLAVERQYRGHKQLGAFGVFDLLIKGIIEHSLNTATRYWYVVVAEPIYRLLLSKGLPCERLGPLVQMPDGVQTLAVRIDLTAFLAVAPQFFTRELDRPMLAKALAI